MHRRTRTLAAYRRNLVAHEAHSTVAPITTGAAQDHGPGLPAARAHKKWCCVFPTNTAFAKLLQPGWCDVGRCDVFVLRARDRDRACPMPRGTSCAESSTR